MSLDGDNVQAVSSRGMGCFATLATRLKNTDVTTFSLGDHNSHNCHTQKNRSLQDQQNYFDKSGLIGQWIKIMIEGGHVQPSQPSVGRLEGWPKRRLFKDSLWTDFLCWCWKQGLIDDEIPVRSLFLDALDLILISNGEFYEFPKLDDCRLTYRNVTEVE